jgi:hypothetical protein
MSATVIVVAAACPRTARMATIRRRPTRLNPSLESHRQIGGPQ